MLKNVGNLVQRVIKFCHTKMDGAVPEYSRYSDALLNDHKKQVNTWLTTYIEHLEATKLRQGLSDVLQISALGNKLLQDNKLDNRLFTEEPDRCAAVIGLALNHIHLLASILSPYMPDSAESIFQQLGVEPVARIPDTWEPEIVKPGHTLGTPKLLFTPIPAAKLPEWRDLYGGQELQKLKALEAEKAAAKKAAKEREKAKKKAKKEAAAAPAAGGKTQLDENIESEFASKVKVKVSDK